MTDQEKQAVALLRSRAQRPLTKDQALCLVRDLHAILCPAESFAQLLCEYAQDLASIIRKARPS